MAAGPASGRPPLAALLAAVGLATFLVAVPAIGARATYGARTTADEPQYLLTALSLAEDIDLDIADEIADQRFLPFHATGLNPQTIDLDGQGQRLSPHDPLLSVLLAPAMGAAGWVGAKAVLALLAAATAMATTWVAVRRFDVTPTPAALVVGGFFVSPPLTAYATQVYPEIPAALAVVVAVAALTGPRRPATTLVAGLAVVALPWLSVKYVPVAAVLALGLMIPPAVGPARDRRRLGLVVAGLGLAAVAYAVVHQRVYGGWTVYAAGDHFVGGEFQVVGNDPRYLGRTRRLVGLLVDRRFGLIPWTPAFLLVTPALAVLHRRRTPGWPLLLATIGAGWAVATWVALTMHGWWWPGRQVVVVLPLVAVAIAACVDGRRFLFPMTMVGLALGAAGWLWLVVEASTGRRTLIVDFDQTTSPWYRLGAPIFPDHRSFGLGTVDLVLTASWTVVLLATAVVAHRRAEP